MIMSVDGFKFFVNYDFHQNFQENNSIFQIFKSKNFPSQALSKRLILQ